MSASKLRASSLSTPVSHPGRQQSCRAVSKGITALQRSLLSVIRGLQRWTAVLGAATAERWSAQRRAIRLLRFRFPMARWDLSPIDRSIAVHTVGANNSKQDANNNKLLICIACFVGCKEREPQDRWQGISLALWSTESLSCLYSIRDPSALGLPAGPPSLSWRETQR